MTSTIFRSFFIILFAIGLFTVSFAQNKKTTVELPVSGNCEMCKKRIETAAKIKGVSSVNWNADTKILKIVFVTEKVTLTKISSAIAASGYDTRDDKAPQTAYDKLPGCCKYERKQ